MVWMGWESSGGLAFLFALMGCNGNNGQWRVKGWRRRGYRSYEGRRGRFLLIFMELFFPLLKFSHKTDAKMCLRQRPTPHRPHLSFYCLSAIIFRIQFYTPALNSSYNSQQHQKYKHLNAHRSIFLILLPSLLDLTQNPQQTQKIQTFVVLLVPSSTIFVQFQKGILIALKNIQKDHAFQESKGSEANRPRLASPPFDQQLQGFSASPAPIAIFWVYPLININKLLMLSSLLRRPFLQFSKICNSAEQAIKGIKDGSLLLVGGFGICGVPMNLIHAVNISGVKNLTIASNNCGVGDKDGKADWGLAVLLRNRQIKRMISSYVGENYQFQRQFFNGELELQICPQGTLAEKIRSGGAGIPAFFTATGVDTIIEKGGFPIKYKIDAEGKVALDAKGQKIAEITSEPKPTATFDNRKYVMEKSIFGDFALVKAKRADKMGNLQFQKTERNFNADMATAARCVIAEVEEIVENGELDPETIHTPAVYVDRIYLADPNSPFSAKLIEKLTVSDHLEKKKLVKESDVLEGKVIYNDGKISGTDKDHLRLKIAKRAAKEVRDGMNINLGIGIPTLLPSVLPEDIQINLQSQNGIMGVGPYPNSHQVNANNINAGKETITLLPGGSYFSSSQSFSIIRGGHLDITMLGALEVSENCDIANWIIPGKMMKGMGGAMDLVACGSKVIVLMEHSAKTKDGKTSLKLIQHCRLPLTAKGVVSMVITELSVFENRDGRLVLTEIAEGSSLEEVQSQTGFKLVCAQTVGRF